MTKDENSESENEQPSLRLTPDELDYARRHHYLEKKHAEIATIVPDATLQYFNACISAGMQESMAIALMNTFHEYTLANVSHLLDMAYQKDLTDFE